MIFLPDGISMYDGPSNKYTTPNSKISMSFGVRVDICKSTYLLHETVIFRSTPAPVEITITNSTYFYNSSIQNSYRFYILSRDNQNSVVFKMNNIYWDGWSGRKCEFGGIWFDSLVSGTFDAGPFCNKYGYLERNIILRRDLYLYRGRLVLYGLVQFFNLQVEFMARSPSKHALTLPMCVPNPRVSINEKVGFIEMAPFYPKCQYELYWRKNINVNVEILPLCVASLQLVSLEFIVETSQLEAVSHLHEADRTDPGTCQHSKFTERPTFKKRYGSKTASYQVKYTRSSSCCWLEPVLKVSLTMKSDFKIHPRIAWHVTIKLPPEIPTLDLYITKRCRSILLESTELTYIHVTFKSQSSCSFNITIDNVLLCFRHYDPSKLTNDNRHVSFEWKSKQNTLYFVVNTAQTCVTRIKNHLTISYSIHNYTSFASDWENMPPNRVFTPYYRNWEVGNGEPSHTPYRILKYAGTSR